MSRAGVQQRQTQARALRMLGVRISLRVPGTCYRRPIYLLRNMAVSPRYHQAGFDTPPLPRTSLTLSSRGRLVRDRATGSPKLTCRNWESGVIVLPTPSPPTAPTQVSSMDAKPSVQDMFEGRVPLPIQIPGQPFDEDGRRTPWYYQDG